MPKTYENLIFSNLINMVKQKSVPIFIGGSCLLFSASCNAVEESRLTKKTPERIFTPASTLIFPRSVKPETCQSVENMKGEKRFRGGKTKIMLYTTVDHPFSFRLLFPGQAIPEHLELYLCDRNFK